MTENDTMSLSRPYRLLITGSRQATKPMIAHAKRAVEHAAKNNWVILVGDAHGIDEAVMEACLQYDVPFTCYGVRKEPNSIIGNANYRRIFSPELSDQFAEQYKLRDRVMAEECDRVYAIWNGKSTGTIYTYNQVKKMGKPADIKDFSKT